jgi:hypothetical protein
MPTGGSMDLPPPDLPLGVGRGAVAWIRCSRVGSLNLLIRSRAHWILC